MAETTKHVLAACDGKGAPVAYLSSAKSWTNSLNEAVYFASRHEADDFLRANAHDANPGPVRSVCVAIQDNHARMMNGNPNRVKNPLLHTGIYG